MSPTLLSRRRARGASMIEILVTLIILLVGLLGLAGVMLQSQRSQIESYERVQALVLLQDMVDRINANRAVAGCYVVTNNADLDAPFVGTAGAALPVCTSGTAAQNARVQTDLAQWRDLLLGNTEALSGADVGVVLGGRGCIAVDPLVPNRYQITVSWQGRDETAAPPAAVPCARNEYGGDKLRRAVSVVVQIANLT